MDITISKQESTGAVRHLAVTIPAAAVQGAEDKVAKRYVSQARLPGFRPGKAPAGMVRKRFADAIRQDTLQDLVQAAYQQALEQETLDIIAQPHIHDLTFEPGQDVRFTLHLEVRPEVKLEKLEGFSVLAPSTQVTDEMVTAQLDALRDQKATWAPVEEQPVPGDRVKVALAVEENDGSMAAQQDYDVVLGQSQAIPGIEELIMEATPGQTIEREVKWPDDFPDESQRGKMKKAVMTLKEVKRKTVPALDDAFAREVGDFDSLEALTTTVRNDLTENVKRDSDAEGRAKLLDEIIDANPFDVPPTWVRQLVESYANAYQVPQQDLPRFAEQFTPLAERQVRRDVVVDTIAKQHELKATEADVDAEIEALAAQRGVEVGQLYAALQKANRLGEIEHGVTERKVFEWLAARNTLREATAGEQADAAGSESATPDAAAQPAPESQGDAQGESQGDGQSEPKAE